MNQDIGPNVAAIDLEKLPALLRYWQWFYALTGASAGIISATGIGLLVEGDLDAPVPWGRVAMLLGAILLLLGWRFAILRFRQYQAQWLTGEGVVLRSGVWWRDEAWLPVARLQHVDVHQGPLDRVWGMATLTLHTAGTHDHRLRIAGLPVARAHALRAALLPRVQGEHD